MMALTKEEAEAIASKLDLVVKNMQEIEAICLESIKADGPSWAAAELLEFSHRLAYGKDPDCPGPMADELRRQAVTLK